MDEFLLSRVKELELIRDRLEQITKDATCTGRLAAKTKSLLLDLDRMVRAAQQAYDDF